MQLSFLVTEWPTNIGSNLAKNIDVVKQILSLEDHKRKIRVIGQAC